MVPYRIIKQADTEWVNLFKKIINLDRLIFLEGGSEKILNVLKKSNSPNQFWRDVFAAWLKFTDIYKTEFWVTEPAPRWTLAESHILWGGGGRMTEELQYLLLH